MHLNFITTLVHFRIVFMLSVAQTSLSLVIEKNEGLLERSWVAGVKPTEILFSHIVTQFFFMLGQMSLVLMLMFLFCGITNNGELFLVITLTLLQGFCGMCYGFVISSICESERSAVQVALGSFYPTILLSGVIWPIEGMPFILR
jgi:ABC-type multidrug transport system permease subunit